MSNTLRHDHVMDKLHDLVYCVKTVNVEFRANSTRWLLALAMFLIGLATTLDPNITSAKDYLQHYVNVEFWAHMCLLLGTLRLLMLFLINIPWRKRLLGSIRLFFVVISCFVWLHFAIGAWVDTATLARVLFPLFLWFDLYTIICSASDLGEHFYDYE